MINCPECGRPVSGRARVCGYCGHSLVQNYFSDEERGAQQSKAESSSTGSTVAMVFGIFGALALLVALVFQLLLLFGIGDGEIVAIDLGWWLRIGGLLVVAVVYLSMQVSLRGWRRSLVVDAFWLLVAAAGLSLAALAYLDAQMVFFSHSFASVYLVGIGFALMVFASMVGIFAFRRNAAI